MVRKSRWLANELGRRQLLWGVGGYQSVCSGAWKQGSPSNQGGDCTLPELKRPATVLQSQSPNELGESTGRELVLMRQ